MLDAAGFTTLAGIAAATLAKPDAEAAEVLPATTGQDAELFALADRFMALQVGIDAINADHEDDHEEEQDRLIHAQASILDEMANVSATTLEGQRQRARVLMAWYGCASGYHGAVFEWERLQPLFSDLLGETV